MPKLKIPARNCRLCRRIYAGSRLVIKDKGGDIASSAHCFTKINTLIYCRFILVPATAGRCTAIVI